MSTTYCPRCHQHNVQTMECLACGGAGWNGNEHESCPECAGDGSVEECWQCGWRPGDPVDSEQS
jgi:DnaJ-class molecular chaperone